MCIFSCSQRYVNPFLLLFSSCLLSLISITFFYLFFSLPCPRCVCFSSFLLSVTLSDDGRYINWTSRSNLHMIICECDDISKLSFTNRLFLHIYLCVWEGRRDDSMLSLGGGLWFQKALITKGRRTVHDIYVCECTVIQKKSSLNTFQITWRWTKHLGEYSTFQCLSFVYVPSIVLKNFLGFHYNY